MLIGNRGKFVLALLVIVSILAAFEHDAEAADAPTFGTTLRFVHVYPNTSSACFR